MSRIEHKVAVVVRPTVVKIQDKNVVKLCLREVGFEDGVPVFQTVDGPIEHLIKSLGDICDVQSLDSRDDIERNKEVMMMKLDNIIIGLQRLKKGLAEPTIREEDLRANKDDILKTTIKAYKKI